MMGHGDQREGATTERVTGIDDRDGGVWTCAVIYRGSYVVEVSQCPWGR